MVSSSTKNKRRKENVALARVEYLSVVPHILADSPEFVGKPNEAAQETRVQGQLLQSRTNRTHSRCRIRQPLPLLIDKASLAVLRQSV